jgi:hypothetical protein
MKTINAKKLAKIIGRDISLVECSYVALDNFDTDNRYCEISLFNSAPAFDNEGNLHLSRNGESMHTFCNHKVTDVLKCVDLTDEEWTYFCLSGRPDMFVFKIDDIPWFNKRRLI